MKKRTLTRLQKTISIVNILFTLSLFFGFYIHIQNPNHGLMASLVLLQCVLFFLNYIYYLKSFNLMEAESQTLQNQVESAEGLREFIMENDPSGVTILDANGIIQYVNPAVERIFGTRERLGKNLLEFETVRNTSLELKIRQGLRGLKSEAVEVKYIFPVTQETKYLNVYIVPIIDKNGKVKNVILIYYDITRETNLRIEMESTYISMMEALAESLDARDTYTGKHSTNVRKYTSLLCSHLSLNTDERRKIDIAASIHDIGKVGIEDCILKKPDKLTAVEYHIMKKHTVIGAGIVNKIKGYGSISEIIKHHHERWDGGGYPSGLKGTDIPIGSQIIAIADAYDAMTSNRVYRAELGGQRAKNILLDEKGKQFNEELVDLFIAALDETDHKEEITETV